MIEALYEGLVLLLNGLRHQTLDGQRPNLIVVVAKQLTHVVIVEQNLAEVGPVGIHDEEVGVFCGLGARPGEVFLVHLIDLENALHLADVQLIPVGVIENVHLHKSNLEVVLIVFEQPQVIQLIELLEYLPGVLSHRLKVIQTREHKHLLPL